MLRCISDLAGASEVSLLGLDHSHPASPPLRLLAYVKGNGVGTASACYFADDESAMAAACKKSTQASWAPRPCGLEFWTHAGGRQEAGGRVDSGGAVNLEGVDQGVDQGVDGMSLLLGAAASALPQVVSSPKQSQRRTPMLADMLEAKAAIVSMRHTPSRPAAHTAEIAAGAAASPPLPSWPRPSPSGARGDGKCGSCAYGEGVAALLPLTRADRIVAALRIVRNGGGGSGNSGGGSGVQGAYAEGVFKGHTAARDIGAAPRSALPPQQTTPSCPSYPSLLASGSSLQQLALAASAYLLGGDGAEQLEALAVLIRSLASATSLQALFGALCGGAAAHVRQRFLADPRVTVVVVPEHTAAVGLMCRWEDAAAAETMLAAPAQLTSSARSRTIRPEATRPQVFSAVLEDSEAAAPGSQPPALDSGGAAGTVGMAVAASGPGRLAAASPPVRAGDGGKRAGFRADAVAARPQTSHAAHAGASWQDLRRMQSLGSTGTAESDDGGGGGRALDSLVPADPAALLTDLSAVAAGGCGALHAKPVPLAQTLLQQLLLRQSAVAAAALGRHARPLEGAGTAAPWGNAATAQAPAGFYRVAATEVEDCVAHVQDPLQPSADVLTLLYGAKTTNGGCGGGVSRNTTSSGFAGGTGEFGHGGNGAGGVAFAPAGRGLGSLVLLALPTGDGRGVLALYVTFAEKLPVPLLRAARGSLQELMQVAAPLVARRLGGDLSLELRTLATAGPGCYAVPTVTASSNRILGTTGLDEDFTGFNTVDTLSSPPPSRQPSQLPSPPTSHPQAKIGGESRPDASAPVLPSLPAGLGTTSTEPGSAWGNHLPPPPPTWKEPHGGGGGGAGRAAERGPTGPAEAHFPSFVVDEGDRPAVAGPSSPAASAPGRLRGKSSRNALLRVPSAGALGQATGREHLVKRSASVIRVEELDSAHITMRTQLPLLVASLQRSISNAHLEVALAAAGSCVGSPRRHASGSIACSEAAPKALGDVDAATRADLAQLELGRPLGHGGYGVVFRGRLGTVDCAVKLLEMPSVDGAASVQDHRQPTAAIIAAPTATAAGAGAGVGDLGDEEFVDEDAAVGPDGPGADLPAVEPSEAKRALLRNAMEMAAMAALSHPNIIQVYSMFNGVVLESRRQQNGGNRFTLRPAADTEVPGAPGSVGGGSADMSPVCLAIVCEWCDRGCLATAIAKQTLTRLKTRAAAPQTDGSAAAGKAAETRVFDFRAILMTLLDVAMAMRHMHAHNLIHRDIKPANVLLKANPTDPRGFTAKLADFGFVTLLTQPGNAEAGQEPFVIVDESCGTVGYMAPEALQKHKQSAYRLDARCDVFSFGVLMWSIVSGKAAPFPKVTHSAAARLTLTGVRPAFQPSVPQAYRLLAQRCWAANPQQRPSSGELVAAVSGLLAGMDRRVER